MGAQATADGTTLVHAHDHPVADLRRRWAGIVSLNGPVVTRMAALMLAGGALLAFAPIHPGLLCPLRASTGVPCPACGMTTSIKECLRGDLAGAWAANPGGIAAVGVALAVVIIRPAAIRVRWSTVALVVAAMWIFQLFRFSVL